MSLLPLENQLAMLYQQWCGELPDLVLPLAPSGSARIYYRLEGKGKSVIGAYNPQEEENRAFLHFSKHFKAQGLPVPEIYIEDNNRNIYLQEDLGFTTLYSFLLQRGEEFPEHLIRLYQAVVEQLAVLQIKGGEGLDYGYCFPRQDFDKQSMLWDFNMFKYYFLRLSGTPYDEQALENDLHQLADYLLTADSQYFMFRDFQTRNIMIKGGQPYFIDYQGGRRGALQYDLASLLFQAKANIPPAIREQLLEHYLDKVETMISVDRENFTQHYYGFVLIRTLQVLGAYGYRGLYERKQHFLQSIPFALKNLRWLLEEVDIPVELPTLRKAAATLVKDPRFRPFDRSIGARSLLTVSVQSFSYKKDGVPADSSGNGGGFVFDCRALHNPGRYEPYKKLTGRDESVINFLNHHSEMPNFINDVFRIVDRAVEDYIERSFTHLQVSFGCTGGQHRSVYAADALAEHLDRKYGIRVKLHHIQQEKKGWVND